MKTLTWKIAGLLAFGAAAFSVSAADAKIVLLAGRPSHGAAEHEFRAGALLLQKCLNQLQGVQTVVVSNGWPTDESVFTGAQAVIFFADGGNGHPAIKPDRIKLIDGLAKKGVGIGAMHYGVEVPKGDPGNALLDWIGGYFETFWSVNPHWDADFKTLPQHPVTRGVKPFKIRDEWYYHMRFREGMQGVTPILSAVPPESTRGKPGVNSPHGGNPAVQARTGQAETVMWVYDRPDGGRGFGFTGAHFHANWGNPNFRKIVLNALLWVAKQEVPTDGVACEVPPADLKQNLDPKGGPKPAQAVNPPKDAGDIKSFISPTTGNK